MHAAIHSVVPSLRVSPLALPPRLATCEVMVSMDDCEDGRRRDYQLLIGCKIHKTREDAGSTLPAGLRGPKSGVHFNLRRGNRPCKRERARDKQQLTLRRQESWITDIRSPFGVMDVGRALPRRTSGKPVCMPER